MEFLIKFVSGLGRIMSSFLLRPDFLCMKRSLNSVTVKPFVHLKTNSVSRTLYIVSRLSHPVRVKKELEQASKQEKKQEQGQGQEQKLDYLTIRPVARKGCGSIAHEAKPNGLLTRGP